jgi:hypothetical protein
VEVSREAKAKGAAEEGEDMGKRGRSGDEDKPME